MVKRSLLNREFSSSVHESQLKSTLTKFLISDDISYYTDNNLEYDRRSLLICYLVVLHLVKIDVTDNTSSNFIWYQDNNKNSILGKLFRKRENGLRLLKNMVYTNSERKLGICFHGLENEYREDHFLIMY